MTEIVHQNDEKINTNDFFSKIIFKIKKKTVSFRKIIETWWFFERADLFIKSNVDVSILQCIFYKYLWFDERTIAKIAKKSQHSARKRVNYL